MKKVYNINKFTIGEVSNCLVSLMELLKLKTAICLTNEKC